MRLQYLTVNAFAENKGDNETCIKSLLSLLEQGYQIISAVGDGSVSVHYILQRVEPAPAKVTI